MSWLVEEGIGEHRAILYRADQPVAARMDWPGALSPGLIADAVLAARIAGSPRGRARFAGGQEAVVDHLPKDASEGATIRLEVTRAMLREGARIKPAQARPTKLTPRAAPSLIEGLCDNGEDARLVRRFPDNAWTAIWQEAWGAEVAFSGGALLFSVTPAMTLVDVDGHLGPRDLALAAIPPLALAIRRFDLGGALGIDFPSLSEKADRRRIDAALEAALGGWPHERTAMNGFGFVQLVARLERPSLLHRMTQDPEGAAARLLLRGAEALDDPGVLLLTCHPAVEARLKSEWLAELARRTGRAVRVAADPSLALDGGFAQVVAP